MPTQEYFSKLPPFPSDVPVAQLRRISYAKLLELDEAESALLFDACQTHGFFLLDFDTCSKGQEFLNRAERMFELTEEVNAEPVEELMKYAYKPPHSLIGYKETGNLKIEDGRPDRFEFYAVGQDDMTGVSKPLANPSCIEANRADLKTYMEQAHEVIELICDHLELQLRLPKDSLANLQPLSLSSGTSLRMIRCLPQPQDDLRTSIVGHTDIGSMTLLFNALGGLQILPPDTDATKDSSWVYVQPQPGCAIINLGDAMVEWSAGILRSNMHRVIYGPGEQAKVTRYSLAYLLRPFSDAPMKRLSGGQSLVPPIGDDEEENLMTSREWEIHRAAAIRAGKDNARSRGGRKIIIPAKSAITADLNSATAVNTVTG